MWLVLCVGRYKERWNLELKLMPVLLGAVHAMTGNSMPSRVPAKGLLIHLYIFKVLIFLQHKSCLSISQKFISTFGTVYIKLAKESL